MDVRCAAGHSTSTGRHEENAELGLVTAIAVLPVTESQPGRRWPKPGGVKARAGAAGDWSRAYVQLGERPRHSQPTRRVAPHREPARRGRDPSTIPPPPAALGLSRPAAVQSKSKSKSKR
uniref:Uncharacterized protein n=1 Tax=Oryza barthii TaxID=65489 RepID=A0A0D3ETC6_9ORYZ